MPFPPSPRSDFPSWRQFRRAARRLCLRHSLHRARRFDAGRAGARQCDRRRLHALADRGRAGGVVPRLSSRRQGARHRRQFGKFQCRSPAVPARKSSRPRRRHGATIGLRPQGGVHLVDRCDRRAAARGKNHRGVAAGRAVALGRWLGAGGSRHHDDRYLSERSHRDRRDRRRRSPSQRLRQGLRHDRARHGDDARLCLHRRGAAPGGTAAAARRGGRPLVQLHHGRWRHFDQRHGAAVRHPAGPAPAGGEPGRSAARRIFAARSIR